MNNVFKKTLATTSIFLAFGFSNIAVANILVDEGTYVGTNTNRANISSYKDQGIYNYDLILTSLRSREFHQFYAVQRQPLQVGKTYTFKVKVSEYDDDSSNVSQCSLKAIWGQDGALEVTGDSNCRAERSKLGLYSFSQQASFIPQQYWGKWGKTNQCNDTIAIIKKNWLTHDNDWGAATVLDIMKNSNGSLDISGVEIYEDNASSSYFNIQLLNNKLNIKGEHHSSDFNQSLVKCKDQNL